MGPMQRQVVCVLALFGGAVPLPADRSVREVGVECARPEDASNLTAMQALPETRLLGAAEDLIAVDGCALRLLPQVDHQDFGVRLSFVTPPGLQALSLRLALSFVDGDGVPVAVELQRVEGGGWSGLAELHPDSNGVITAVIPVDDPWDFVDSEGVLLARLRIQQPIGALPLLKADNGREDVDVDQVEIETDP